MTKIKEANYFLQLIITIRVSWVLILVQYLKFQTILYFHEVIISPKIKQGKNLTGKNFYQQKIFPIYSTEVNPMAISCREDSLLLQDIQCRTSILTSLSH